MTSDIFLTLLLLAIVNNIHRVDGSLPKLTPSNNRRVDLQEDSEIARVSGLKGDFSYDYGGGYNEDETCTVYNDQITRSQVKRAFDFLPSLFSKNPSSKNDQISVKEGSRRRSVNYAKQPANSNTVSLFDIISPRWSNGANVDQLKRATEQLLHFMALSAGVKTNSNYRRRGRESVIHFKEITDKSVLDILSQFPLQNVPFDMVLKTLIKVWSNVQTNSHRVIFEEVSSWAISVISRNFPSEYATFLDFIITNDFQYPTYQHAVKHVRLLNHQQIEQIVRNLLQHLLEINADKDDYKFYGKFNIHFMEIAMKYPEFSKVPFVQNFQLPASIIPTHTLHLIYKSISLVEIFSKSIFNSAHVASIISNLATICIELDLSAFMLAEQIHIILNLNRDHFDHKFDDSGKVVLLNLVYESLWTVIKAQNLFPEVPDKAVYALAIRGNFDDILVLMIRHLHPFFTVDEFGFLLNLADRVSGNEPYGTLLTLLGSISVPRAAWSCSDAFVERSFRVHLYIEALLSIQEQKLTFTIDPNENSLCTSVHLLGKTKKISWVLPRALNEDNYEIIKTADMLVIPLLFIQRVFQRDYRKSKIIDKYLRAGKPNYRQFARIINELLEDQCYSLSYQYPVVEVELKLQTKFYGLPQCLF